MKCKWKNLPVLSTAAISNALMLFFQRLEEFEHDEGHESRLALSYVTLALGNMEFQASDAKFLGFLQGAILSSQPQLNENSLKVLKKG